MASRIVSRSLRASTAAVARPQVAAALPRLTIQSRGMADSTSAAKPDPKTRASSLLDALPGNSLISKTGWVTLGTGLGAVAISKELYVANEETVLAAAFFIFLAFVAKSVREPYVDWAEGHITRIRNILNSARAEHTEAVRSRINDVTAQKDVVDITKALFAISKETAELEAQVFELKQKTAIAAEVKNVLDSWVRYEGQQRESEQKELARSVIQKVLTNLKDEKLQREILVNAVTEVEQLVKNKAI